MEFEIESVCNAYNISLHEYFRMSDIYVTRHLIAKRLNSAFEQKYMELKSKQKKH